MKKTLAFIMSVVVVLSMLVPIGAFAAPTDNGFRITHSDKTTNDYTTITDAVAAIKAGDTLTMYENAELTAALAITANNVTIDGNGKKITVTGGADVRTFDLKGSAGDATFNKDNRQNVVIKNLTIDFQANGGGSWSVMQRADVNLTMENVTINSSANEAGYYQNNAGVLTLKDCEINVSTEKIGLSVANAAAETYVINTDIVSPNRAICVYSGASVSINGGYFEGKSDSTIQVSDGSVEIEDGHFKAYTKRCLRVINASEVNVFGGYFENGAAADGSELVALENEAYLAVYGGYFKHEGQRFGIRHYHSSWLDFYNGYVVCNGQGSGFENYGAIGSKDANDTKDITANIYGGTFVTTNSTAVVNYGKIEYNVYGGSFYNLSTTGSKTLDGSPVYPEGQAGIVHAVKTLGDGVVTEATRTGITSTGISYLATNAPITREGATVRFDSTKIGDVTYGSGLRFVSDIDKDIVAYANKQKDKDTKLSYGTVICPTEYLADVEVFTMEALDAAGKTYLNIAATEKGTAVKQDGAVSIYSAITDIKAANYTKDFSAVAYIAFEKDGVMVYVYGVFDAEKNTRNAAEVANAALADTSVTYTAEQKAILDTFAGK